MDVQELIMERGYHYWIDSEGERISPEFATEDEAWTWLDMQPD